MTNNIHLDNGYSHVNGIKLYYEIYGQGEPLVLIHGGGSTIESSFGKIISPLANHYMLIAVELQNHGRSGFRNVPQTFEQDADDVAALLADLKIKKASFLGFSNGGSTAMQLGIRHPEIVNKLIIIAGAYKRNGFIPGFFDGMQQVSLKHMPRELQIAFLKVNPDPDKLQIMFERDRDRMIAFKDWDDEKIKNIKAPALIINGDTDVVKPEHALELYRLFPDAQLAILPGIHGECIGEITTVATGNDSLESCVQLIQHFLRKSGKSGQD